MEDNKKLERDKMFDKLFSGIDNIKNKIAEIDNNNDLSEDAKNLILGDINSMLSKILEEMK